MGKFSPQSTAPRYMQAFKCIGPACEESCCSGWQVPIDKRTYQQYRSIRIEPLAGLLQRHIVKTELADTRAFASVKLDDNGDCPFLDETRLCQIQGTLGEDALSDTCNHYPRLFARNVETLSTYASLSCPEAARLALLDPQALDMGTLSLNFPNASRIPFSTVRAAPVPGKSDAVQRHADLIREGLSAIIRYPGHSASQALLVCGIVVRRIAEQLRSAVDADAADQAVLQTLTRFMDGATLDQARRLSEELQTPQDARVALLQQLTTLYVSAFPARPSFRAQIEAAMQGLGHEQTDLAGMQARYAAAEAQWFAPFDALHPHILKNYLLNDLGKSLFPVGTAADIESELMHLSVRFALIKMYLVGQAGQYREAFDASHCVKTIYTFVRNIEHNPKFLPAVMGLLAEQGFSNLATLATLVK